ncbi:MAG: hypothetical protein LBD75_02870 [Candidatus Peribacteria bacterium]|nr:hypothetical protein [Candidatus Peribacteria bacterium]
MEYFYATTFQEKYPLCEKSYCTQLSPDMVSYKNISVKGYFILLPKEEYFLCTETGDPTCFPPSTGVYNVYFLINT